MRVSIASILVGCLILAGCDGAPRIVAVGVQSSAEQSILSQMVKQLIEDRTSLRATIVECGDAYGCTQALYLKRIDLMVGYSGTGLMYSPLRTARNRGTLKEVRELYQNADITWLDGLGFESGYELVFLRSKSRELGIATIGDLRKLSGGVRVACSSAYLDRFGDGLSSLLRRYGLSLRGEPLVIDDPIQRIMELFRRGADVAIVGRSSIPKDPGLTTLRDRLSFFPHYEAAIVARNDTLASRPELKEALALLNGRLKTPKMRQLVSEVLVNGWAPGGVARRFLQEQDLLIKEIDPLGGRLIIEIAIEESEQPSKDDLVVVAVRAVRQALPNYPVKVLPVDDPVRAVVQGRARLAIVGAQKFFRDDREELFSTREKGIEAAAVIGTPYLHILRRMDDPGTEHAFTGRIGVPPEGSQEARVASAILRAAGREPDVFLSGEILLEQLEEKKVDVALLFRMPGEPWIARQILERQLVLHDLPAIEDKLPPFLQPSRFPPRTYRHQTEVVRTEGVQVLLAGPAPRLDTGPPVGSPAAALISQSPPLTLAQARAMQEAVEAIRTVEPPHPVLPSVWLRSIAEGTLRQGPTTAQAIVDTSLNVLVILFVGWVIALVARSPRR